MKLLSWDSLNDFIGLSINYTFLNICHLPACHLIFTHLALQSFFFVFIYVFVTDFILCKYKTKPKQTNKEIKWWHLVHRWIIQVFLYITKDYRFTYLVQIMIQGLLLFLSLSLFYFIYSGHALSLLSLQNLLYPFSILHLHVLSPDTDPSILVLILCWTGFSCKFNLVALIHTLNCLNCCRCGFFSFGVWVSILHLFRASGSPNNTKRLNDAYNYTVNVMNFSHDCIYSIV